jgi:serine/threonine protein phosphatase 1
MSLTYVIADIHGRNDLLNDALAGIAAHSAGEACVIVTIGDYVDKGPDSKAVIERLLEVAPGWSLVALKGNHDAMMVEALRDPAKMASWIEEGGRRFVGILRGRSRHGAASSPLMAGWVAADAC